MASLAWEIDGNVLHDEARHHVYDSLFYLKFFRDLILRTGLREAADSVGWIWGSASDYYGWFAYEMESDHLNRILAILDLPVERAWIDSCTPVAGGEAELVYLDGKPLEANEEDLLITLYGEQDDLDRLVMLLAAIDPSIEFCLARARRFVPEAGPPATLAEAWGRQESDDEGPRVSIFVKWGAADSYSLYPGLFTHLIRAWEVMRGGKTY